MTSKAALNTLPTVIKKLVVRKVTQKFREAVELVSVPIPSPGPGQVLIRNRFIGINASDINYTAARYDTSLKPPFDCGFEGVGQIVSIGPDCKRSTVGQSVGYMQFGAFAEYTVVKELLTVPLPATKAQYVPLLVSGLTAAISLDKVGQLKPNETVIVTAAAGGTGQFAVQWAKSIGCHVIGVCSSPEKVEFLRSIGCDRPIDYKTENLAAVLKAEYPKGVDVVYECIGGEIFETCLNSLAVKGRIIIIGFISGYEDGKGGSPLKIGTPALMSRLLGSSQSLRGFMLMNFASDYAEYTQRLVKLLDEGKITSAVDTGRFFPGGGPFRGVEAIPDAVEYLYGRKNVGKIVVECGEPTSVL